MKPIYRAVLVAFAVTLSISAVTASSAFAAPEWYSAVTPQWQLGGTPVSEAVPTTWKGKFDATIAGPFGEVVAAECNDSGEGSSGPGTVGKVTKLTFAKCASSSKTCENPTMEAADLPWNTELYASAGTMRDNIIESGKGAPGYTIECTVTGIKYADKCTGSISGRIKGEGLAPVTATLAGKLTCTNKVSGSGVIEGTQELEDSARPLRILEVHPAFNKVTSAIEVKAKGEVSVTDTKYPAGAVGEKCKVETTGTVEAGGAGKITSYSVGSCTPLANCELSGLRGKVSNLPWKTELYEASGTVRDRIISGGSGTPEFRIECSRFSVFVEDSCSLSTTTGMANGLEENNGVIARFDSSSNTTSCAGGGSEAGKVEGELKIPRPESLLALAVKK
ncbi:MAG TPA: hypothetical protein VGL57_08335 [Solirubrobacteraceae bacterium]|jgi:hypothetical protein